MLADMAKTTSTQKQSWKDLLDKNGFTEVWYNPHLIHKEMFLAIFKRRLTNNFIVELRAGLNHSISVSLFREISEIFRIVKLKREMLKKTKHYTSSKHLK